MKLFGYEIFKAEKSTYMQNVINEVLKKDNSILSRPMLSKPSFKFTRSAQHLIWLQQYAKNSDIVTLAINSLKRDIFKEGFDIVPAFVKKCKVCGLEYEEDIEVCDCGGALIEPDKNQIDIFERFIKKANENGQTFEEVLKEIENDFETIDDGYLFCNFEYIIEGKKVSSRNLKELIRTDPIQVEWVIDNKNRLGYSEEGFKVMACPKCRKIFKSAEEVCDICDIDTINVGWYVIQDDGSKYPVFKTEMVHSSKWFPSITTGHPPIMVLLPKIKILEEMEKTIQKYFKYGRIPGLLFVQVSNLDSWKATWEMAKQQKKEDPANPVLIPVETGDNGGLQNIANYIQFMPGLKDMEYTEIRSELRRNILAWYGIMPLFQGDMAGVGGLNSEGTQVEVTQKAIKEGKGIYNNNMFPRLLNLLEITDYDLVLLEKSSDDEKIKLENEQINIDNMSKMVEAGFEAEYEGEEFKYSGTGTRPKEQSFNSAPFSKSIKKEDDTELIKKINILIKKYTNKIKGASILSLKDLSVEISKDLKKELKQLVGINLEKVYKETIVKVEEDVGYDIGFDKEDLKIIENFKSSDFLINAYDSYENDLADTLKEVLTKSYKNPKDWGIDKIVKEMTERTNESVGRLRTIARTETHNISTIARENSYEKAEIEGEEFKYKWIGPRDNRTTPYCTKITELTKHGVSMKELKNIIAEYSDKNTFKSGRAFTPHINCRHTFVRVV